MELVEIQNKNPELSKKCERLLKAEKIAKSLNNAGEMIGIKEMISSIKKMIENCNDRLINEVEMDLITRASIFKEKECWEWFLLQFDKQNGIITMIDNFKQKYD